MHCLSAIVGGPPVNGLGSAASRGSVLSVIQALGVLVCEGRIQGSPRGYKEGPHCAAPLQSEPSHHVCEKNDYLCNRYFVLVKEISDRVSIGANLCVEVFMCCECPCGHATAICNNPVSPIPATSIMQWQQCELLLEYWLISVVSSKSSEMMNSQGLYQAVRSRLHFSQVAAWWSRSQGAKPAYIVTRVVPCAADNLSKFRETPIEHTFPQASIGDGNSVKVTVWALPRMEEVPTLTCPIHKEEECTARALTPTKTVSSCPTDLSAYVLPALVDDRLQTPCNQPGKHHCRCEDEDGCPPSLSIKTNGERKRRRSLPCGPSDVGTCTNFWNLPLASVRETCHSSIVPDTARTNKNQEKRLETSFGIDNRAYMNTGILERCFRAQVSLEIPEGNEEKRYKLSSTTVTTATPNLNNSDDKFNCFTPYVESIWLSKSDKSDGNVDKIITNNDSEKFHHRQPACETNRQVNPSGGQKSDNLFVYHQNRSLPTPVHCSDALNKSTKVMENSNSKDLSQLMSKLSFPKETGPEKPATMINWMSKTTNRVLSTSPDRLTHDQADGNMRKSKLKNFLPLSQRESDDILTVLRGKTPSARRRTAVKMLQRRLEHVEKIPEDEFGADEGMKLNKYDYLIHSETRKSAPEVFNDCNPSVKSEDDVSNKADVLLRAILRNKSDQDGFKDISSGINGRKNVSSSVNGDSKSFTNSRILAEDEKFLPSVLNKKLHRFKQLFKKEQDKKEMIDPKLNYSDSYAKRKFNLTNCQTHKSDSLAALHSNNPLSHSTNSDFPSKQCQMLRNDSSLSVLSVDRHGNAIPIEKKIKEDHYRHGKNPFFEDSSEIFEEENTDKGVPSVIEQEQFRRSLENAASMVFHSRTGLPLTSSPAPLRRGSSCFDYDSSLNSVSSKRSALFELNTPPSPGAVSLEEADREAEIAGEGDDVVKRSSFLRNRPQSHALLGSFEESALNGRLEPVSTVHGFTAEIGASGSFCPKHRKLPVTVFFYTLGDNDKVSTPYLAHLNLGKKGYQVPRNGTIQVTLLNPLGTVVKMFVVLYDLSDMPPRSHTFLRQRTLRDKTLRYLIHLRFMSGKTGRIYLHTDIRIIICRKSDVDTASDFGSEPPKELRSYIHGPSNPKFSPRC